MASIKSNFIFSSILTISNYIFPLLTFPYISRVLGVNNVGLCNFVDSIINYCCLFASMGISTIGIRETARNKSNKTELSKTFRDLLCLNIIFTIIVVTILMVSSFVIPQLVAHKELVWVGIVKIVMTVLLVEWFYKGLEEFRYITIRSILVKALYVVAVFMFVRESSDYKIYYYISATTVLINALFNLVHLRSFINFKIGDCCIKRFLGPFITLGGYAILTSMYTSFNVVYLGFISGETEVGFYTTATKLFSLAIALYSAFTGVMLPRMSNLIAENRISEFNKMISKSSSIILKFAIPIVLLFLFFSPLIVRVIGGQGYEGASLPMRIISPLLVIIGCEQILVIQILMPLKKDKEILHNSILGAFVGVVANVVLIPYYASVGSSIVWFLSEITILLASMSVVNKCIKLSISGRMIAKEIFKCIPLTICFSICYLYENNISEMSEIFEVSFIICVVTLIHYYWSFRDLLKVSTFKL